MDDSRFKALVRSYQIHDKPRIQAGLDFYRQTPKSKVVIRNAAMAIGPDGKRHRHQRRLDGKVLKRVAKCLVKREEEIAASKDFDTLMGIVESCKFRGFGKLAIYDTANRIGARLGLPPGKVYLHRGTLIGARRLGMDVSRGYVLPEELPEAVQVLTPDEIEDFLCIYNSKFQTGDQDIH